MWPDRAAALSAFLRGDPARLTAQAAPDPESAVGAQPEQVTRTLVVAAERDGATPYAGALELQRRLGAGASLVTERGAGSHGAVGGRNGCVDRHVERYLLTGATPGWRVTCAPHPEPAPVSLDDRAASAHGALLPPVV
ncbi:alpha/beta hydrolase [Streptomyces sp. NPDC056402]|uniref:alpha/beta hydrolase n=1 Tax=Streptomyces sp. NPDC056402 TaxID=3345810 RepID=UPI0035DD6229